MPKKRLAYGPAAACKNCKFCISAFNLPFNTPKSLELSKAKGDFLCVLNMEDVPPVSHEKDPCGFFSNPEVHPEKFPNDIAGYISAFANLFDVTQRAKIGEDRDSALNRANAFYVDWWNNHRYWADYTPYPVNPMFTCEHFEGQEK